MKKLLFLTILISMTLTGCARHGKIIVDPQGVDMARYNADLAYCKELSKQVEQKAGKGVVKGAAVGAVTGEIIGRDGSTLRGAKLGAFIGLLKGGKATKQERTKVVKNCLRYRGYKILN